MISLAVGLQASASDKLQQPRTRMDSMLQNALWIPDNPPRNLFFNEESLYCGDILVPGYRPIKWMLFGGEDGSRLWSIVYVLATVTNNRLKAIDFVYRSSRTRAGSNITYRRSLDTGSFPEPYSSQSIGSLLVFDIDGPGGERISDVAAVVCEKPDDIKARYFDSGVPLYYKVCYFLTP